MHECVNISCFLTLQELADRIQNVLNNLDSSIGEVDMVEASPSKRARSECNVSYVIVLYTGGTIGMKSIIDGRDEVYKPEKNYLTNALRSIPHLNDVQYVAEHFGDTDDPPCCLPPIRHVRRRIVYWLLEYDPLLDSANITFDDWIRLAKDINVGKSVATQLRYFLQKLYALVDGFVILHGTDTMAYTSSALSFMLCNLGKTIVLTGAQIPVAEVRSDGRENLIGALIVAGVYDIPEVCVYFNNRLLRGNRVTKMDNSGLDAFQSPNCLPLATMEIDIRIHTDMIFRSEPAPFAIHTNLNRNVGLIVFTPSITVEMVASVLATSDGVVLMTYGAGNMPTNRPDILAALEAGCRRGVLIVNVTQCKRGHVEVVYETGVHLARVGVIGGGDMTAECAFTKLAFVLGHDDWNIERRRQAMRRNLRGEMTTTLVDQRRTPSSTDGASSSGITTAETAVINGVMQYLSVELLGSGAVIRVQMHGGDADVGAMKSLVFTPMVCNAARRDDVQALTTLLEAVSDPRQIRSVNAAGRRHARRRLR